MAAIACLRAVCSASLSARRAWIEILSRRCFYKWQYVALRKESVDRNTGCKAQNLRHFLSLSARRAWIEIAAGPAVGGPARVALRKESVDRNNFLQGLGGSGCVALRKESVDRNTASARPSHAANCRSPQGERG